MMIFDLNQCAIANLMQQLSSKTQTIPGEDGLRHMILNTIRFNRMKFSNTGDVIIAVDARNSWRKKANRYYKLDRKETKKQLAPGFDWNKFYQFINQLVEEIRLNFPYYTISVDGAEGDDIIGECVRHYHANTVLEEIVIISGDKDFAQLHFDGRVKQYSPVQKKFITVPCAETARKELIIKGDRSDGVPNILSPDNSFYDKIKQQKMTAGRLDKYMQLEPADVEDPEISRNYYRNTTLIDLNCTPKAIKDEVVRQLEEQQNQPKTSGKLFPYLVKHRLRELQEAVGDFA